MAGYSGKSLIEKLGVKENYSVVILNFPPNYKDEFASVVEKIKLSEKLIDSVDFIQFFTKSKNELSETFPLLKAALVKSGQLWISWPKVSSKVVTDLNENIIREIGLDNGLVDVKVIAVDETWSGLKFVFRLKDR